MRLFRFALWPAAGAALGIFAEQAYFGWSDARHWIPDLVTGWSLIACGLVGWSRRPESRSGPLMAATGFAWFAGNFATAGLGPLDWLAAHALYLYRGPLFHLVLSYPRGRLAGRIERAAVAVGYVAAIVTPAWRSGTTTILLASLLVGVAGRSYLRSAGRERRERLAALQATAFLGAVLAADALVRLAVSTPDVKDATLLANEAALVVLAVSLLAGLTPMAVGAGGGNRLRRRARRGEVGDASRCARACARGSDARARLLASREWYLRRRCRTPARASPRGLRSSCHQGRA